MADWANLPNELLGLIVQQLSFFDDFIVFGAVCKSWKSVSDVEAKPPSPPKFPWLILAEDGDKDDKRIKDKELIQSRRFFNLSNAIVYEFMLPEASSRRCLGTHFGWLFTLGLDLQISLLHPFTRHQIPLPPQPTFTDQYEPWWEFRPEDVRWIFIRKAVLSSNPWKKTTEDYEKHDCAVMTIYGEVSKLAFARLGDTAWTNVQVPSRAYDDIAFYKGHFYAVDCHGVAVVCDIDDDRNPKASVIAPAPKGSRDNFQKYLVESAGDLLMVSRIREVSDDDQYEEGMKEGKYPYHTIRFTVLKLEKCTQEGSGHKYNWVNVNSLGKNALFLGTNTSCSLSTSDLNGCFKANCIYFTDDYLEFHEATKAGGGHDMGVFDMESGTIEPHYAGQSFSQYSTPFWYI